MLEQQEMNTLPYTMQLFLTPSRSESTHGPTLPLFCCLRFGRAIALDVQWQAKYMFPDADGKYWKKSAAALGVWLELCKFVSACRSFNVLVGP